MRRFLPGALGAALCALILSTASSARAGSGFGPLPRLDGKQQHLRLRIVQYHGGKMHVEVRNVGSANETFTADGLYFVPQGDPERAPQRMGAAGPFEVAEGPAWKRRSKQRLRPGQTVRLRLHVYCLDSHRSSPSNGQSFTIARKRLPKRLRRTIVHGADNLVKAGKRRAVQSYIWKVRNRKWIRLQGERRLEKSPRRHRRYRQRRQRIRRPIHRHRIQTRD